MTVARGPAARCKEIAIDCAMTDNKIVFREPICTEHIGPHLLDNAFPVDAQLMYAFLSIQHLVSRLPFQGLPLSRRLSHFTLTLLCSSASGRTKLLPPRERQHASSRIHIGAKDFENLLEAILDENWSLWRHGRRLR